MDEPNGYLGTILSGSGATYSVSVTQDGLIFSTVTATALNITDPLEDVPDGTQVIVLKVGSVYYFQVPVWLP